MPADKHSPALQPAPSSRTRSSKAAKPDKPAKGRKTAPLDPAAEAIVKDWLATFLAFPDFITPESFTEACERIKSMKASELKLRETKSGIRLSLPDFAEAGIDNKGVWQLNPGLLLSALWAEPAAELDEMHLLESIELKKGSPATLAAVKALHARGIKLAPSPDDLRLFANHGFWGPPMTADEQRRLFSLFAAAFLRRLLRNPYSTLKRNFLMAPSAFAAAFRALWAKPDLQPTLPPWFGNLDDLVQQALQGVKPIDPVRPAAGKKDGEGQAEDPAVDPQAAEKRLRLWEAPALPAFGDVFALAYPERLSVDDCGSQYYVSEDMRERLLELHAHLRKTLAGWRTTLEKREARQRRGLAPANPDWNALLLQVFGEKRPERIDFLSFLSIEEFLGYANFGSGEAPESVKAEDLAKPLLLMTRQDLLALPAGFAYWHAMLDAAARLLESGLSMPMPYLSGRWTQNEIRHLADVWVPILEVPESRALFESLCAAAEPFALQAPLPFGERICRRLSARELVFASLAFAGSLLGAAAAKYAPGIKRSLKDSGLMQCMTGILRKDSAFNPKYAALPYRADSGQRFFTRGYILPLYRVQMRWRFVFKLELGEEGRAHRVLRRLMPKSIDLRDAESAQGAEKDAAPAARSPRLLALAELSGAERQQAQDALEAASVILDENPLASWFSPEADEFELPAEALSGFVLETAPALRILGAPALLPPSLQRLRRPRIAAVVKEDGAPLSTEGLLSAAELADFRWEIAIGSTHYTLDEFKALVDKEGELVSYADGFFYAPKSELERLFEELLRRGRLKPWEKVRALLSQEIDGDAVIVPEALRARIAQVSKSERLPPPAGLAAPLRPYQQRGYEWLRKNLRLGFGALLADDMGLGKTVQVIACIAGLKESGELEGKCVLVAAPASLLTNWAREFERFAPGISVRVYHGPKRRGGFIAEGVDVAITSYSILQRDFEALATKEGPWRLLVLDEAHAVKNARSDRAGAAKNFPAASVIAMTGTPVENRLIEFWSIMSVVQPGLFGSAAEFRSEFVEPIEEHRSTKAIERLKRIAAPFMLRRLKSDPAIISDLPERETRDWFTTLTPRQVALYKDCLRTSLVEIEKSEADAGAEADRAGPADPREEARRALLMRRGRILRMITHLKEITNSPSQFLKTESEKPDSGKGEALLELLSRCRESGRKALVFTQFAEMGSRLQAWIENDTGVRPDFLYGGASLSARQAMVDRFQNDPEAQVLIVSLRAGGTGLNLTAASAVIHYDLWWNPAVEQQATDRAYRIGQTRDVIVYRFVTAGTFEEKVNEMLAKKRELAELTVSAGETWIGELSNEEIGEIFRLEKQP